MGSKKWPNLYLAVMKLGHGTFVRKAYTSRVIGIPTARGDLIISMYNLTTTNEIRTMAGLNLGRFLNRPIHRGGCKQRNKNPHRNSR